MFAKTAILASLAVSAASAAGIQARQAASVDYSSLISAEEACATAIEAVYSDMPSPPAALASYEMTATEVDPCDFTLPASLSKVVVSYESAIESWYSDHSAAIDSALALCPTFTDSAYSYSVPAAATSYTDECATVTNTKGAATGTTTGKTTGTTAKTTTGSGSTTTAAGGSTTGSTTTVATPNAGPRETAALGAAALAIAGVLGLAVAL